MVEEKEILISVIIPVYNVEKYLEKCLDSVINQTVKNIEIICVNDGSIDSSAAILDIYATKDKRINVFTQENKGLSGARNTGLNNANGAYIIFLDSDDYFPEYTLDVFLKIAQKTNTDIIVSNKFTKLSSLKQNTLNYEELSYKIHNNPLEAFLDNKRIHSSACNKFYRKDAIGNKRFIEGIYFEDWPFVTTLWGEIKSYTSTNISCYIYNDTNTSITRSNFSIKKVNSYITGIKFVYNYYKNTDKLNIVCKKRISVAIKMLISNVYKSRKDKELVELLNREIKQLYVDKIFKYRYLPLKTLWRLWRLNS